MHSNSRTTAGQMAFGGVMAALAVTVMSLGGLIPIATYVSPMSACIVLQLVLMRCGRRIAWAWYGAVAILSVLLSPDKEAAAVFVFLGYYPILRPWFCKGKLPVVKKLLFFNASAGLLYFLLLKVLGLEEISSEFAEMGMVMGAVFLLLGNYTFLLLDKLLGMNLVKFGRK